MISDLLKLLAVGIFVAGIYFLNYWAHIELMKWIVVHVNHAEVVR